MFQVEESIAIIPMRISQVLKIQQNLQNLQISEIQNPLKNGIVEKCRQKEQNIRVCAHPRPRLNFYRPKKKFTVVRKKKNGERKNCPIRTLETILKLADNSKVIL